MCQCQEKIQLTLENNEIYTNQTVILSHPLTRHFVFEFPDKHSIFVSTFILTIARHGYQYSTSVPSFSVVLA